MVSLGALAAAGPTGGCPNSPHVLVGALQCLTGAQCEVLQNFLALGQLESWNAKGMSPCVNNWLLCTRI